MPYLKIDIFSIANPNNCYGKAGTRVTIAREGFGALIVVDDNGARFPVLESELTETLDGPEMQAVSQPVKPLPNYIPRKGKRPDINPSSSSQPGQGSLF